MDLTGQGSTELQESIECRISRIGFEKELIKDRAKIYNEIMQIRKANLEIAKDKAGKYVIINEDDRYLVDRRKNKEGWWCGRLEIALILDSKKVTEEINSKYTKKNTRVLELNYQNILKIEDKLKSKLQKEKRNIKEELELL